MYNPTVLTSQYQSIFEEEVKFVDNNEGKDIMKNMNAHKLEPKKRQTRSEVLYVKVDLGIHTLKEKFMKEVFMDEFTYQIYQVY